ncbi:Glutathione peroxidase [Cynara cardunculus var. scolymus]|uniref:phospholipid-hydroperoxide glutathione peroxidase n=1 Tax=Cynara cardunculus var. scolymus TaxID=59895 RepID=A0A124SCZ9_CYNCS|nr:Glutathione peroxidase [Cynara cardunculus var. scolymus]
MAAQAKKTVYDFTVKDVKGQDVDLSKYRGKVLLIVNVASQWYAKRFELFKLDYSINTPTRIFANVVFLLTGFLVICWCSGFTNSNYPELTTLYQKYKDQGLEVLAFPCNQFGGQEPGSNEQIQEFACTRFKAEYPVFSKVNVNGKEADPLYKFLKSSKGGFLGDSIKWNFTKFLVNNEGEVVDRYAPTTSPLSIEKDIKKLLNAA